MVGDDAVARPALTLGPDARCLLRSFDQRAKQIDIVIVVLALQHGRHALKSHAGIDRGTRKVDALFLRQLLILHEDEVPDLDEAVAVFLRRAGGAAPDLIAVIVEDLRTGTARAGIAHRPEIIAGRNADDLFVRKPGDLLPEVEGFVVRVIDGHQQALGVETEFLGDQVPGKLDRPFLEIIAEGEIAEHLEKGMVARGIADIVEVVVLAAGADAFLRRRCRPVGALFQAREDVLELYHAGIGEHQRRVVARHERARRHDLVAVRLEIVEEGRPDIIHAAHAMPFNAAQGRS